MNDTEAKSRNKISRFDSWPTRMTHKWLTDQRPIVTSGCLEKFDSFTCWDGRIWKYSRKEQCYILQTRTPKQHIGNSIQQLETLTNALKEYQQQQAKRRADKEKDNSEPTRKKLKISHMSKKQQRTKSPNTKHRFHEFHGFIVCYMLSSELKRIFRRRFFVFLVLVVIFSGSVSS